MTCFSTALDSVDADRVHQILRAAATMPQAGVTAAEAKELLAILTAVETVITFLLNRPVAQRMQEKVRRARDTAPNLTVALVLNPARLNLLLREHEDELFDELNRLRGQRRVVEKEIFRAALARTVKHGKEHQTEDHTQILAALVAFVSNPRQELRREANAGFALLSRGR